MVCCCQAYKALLRDCQLKPIRGLISSIIVLFGSQIHFLTCFNLMWSLSKCYTNFHISILTFLWLHGLLFIFFSLFSCIVFEFLKAPHDPIRARARSAHNNLCSAFSDHWTVHRCTLTIHFSFALDQVE